MRTLCTIQLRHKRTQRVPQVSRCGGFWLIYGTVFGVWRIKWK